MRWGISLSRPKMQTSRRLEYCFPTAKDNSYRIVDHVRNRDRVKIITEKRVRDGLHTSGSGNSSPLVADQSRERLAARAGCCSPIPVGVAPVTCCGNVLIPGCTGGEGLRGFLNMLVKLLLCTQHDQQEFRVAAM